MRTFLPWVVGGLAAASAAAGAVTSPRAPAAAVDFNRDVRPILSQHCFKCHGPDEKQRMAGLRLDVREAAVAPGPGGRRAVVPGKPDQSELVRRIFAHETPRLMPPPSANKPLTDAQKQVLKRWIAGGAGYKQHWAFVPPKQVPLPPVKRKDWPKNAVDSFVLARLEKAGLQPAPPADRYSLARRVYLDLIGLPPTPEEADQFVNDRSPGAYEKLVDRLLASKHYGERWARRWLDLARYADTNGYEKDRPRSIWPYRDWVIDAFNRDMPFDRFTVEQLAGDLLPNATLEQKIATGFHRNTMLNEEGGIDPLEYRFHAMVDRVATTGTTWLGLTVGCAQCHTHKYDPIPHKEYYQLFAFLNNADEPDLDVPSPEIDRKRKEAEEKVRALEADLPNRFPAGEEYRWRTPELASVTAASGATAERLPDGSHRLSGPAPETDTYTVVLEGDSGAVDAIRLEALTDPALGGGGPGRTPHGNFVLTELTISYAPKDAPDQARPVKLVRPQADFSQDNFGVAGAVDGNPKTGWAIHGPGKWNVNRTATFYLEKPVPAGGRWTVRLDQQHGSQHTLGRFRVSLGEKMDDGRPVEVRRRELLDRRFSGWLRQQSERAVPWTQLKPVEAKSNLPLLTIQPDGSVLSSGDQSKRDVYDVKLRSDLARITAVRIEALPDDGLPKHGPGRVYYEGPHGDFFLSEIKLLSGGKPLKWSRAAHSFASGGNGAPSAIDGDPQTGWSINGGQGRAHSAVFYLAEPLSAAPELSLQLLFERYYAAGMGRFRVYATTEQRPADSVLPLEIEELLQTPADRHTAAQRERLFAHYLSVAPELASARDEIKRLRDSIPAYPTTLVFAERPANNPRATYIHHRGEFLQPKEKVEPAVLSVLPSLPPGAPKNRLTFAKWLVDSRNPLTARVTVNRQWAAFFGRGIVRTTEDFGFQGELPTHPELLDWLAVEFMKQGWSMKKLHKLIVTSATYQQDSAAPDQDTRTVSLKAAAPARSAQSVDPQNRLLSRMPRFRVEAELVRDTALKASGLLSEKIGGPSVFPPQPPGVTSEGTYGPLAWNVSQGEDRYRRGLYTFTKRTAPYAMFLTFDAPSGEACVARREVSNTPLQALTLLNDTVFMEAAQALGRMVASRHGTPEERATYLFRRCLTRPPDSPELAMLIRFYEAQKGRLERKELDAAAIAGEGPGEPVERAAWTLVARSLLNLDEAVTRE